jgi:hypothetical protein
MKRLSTKQKKEKKARRLQNMAKSPYQKLGQMYYAAGCEMRDYAALDAVLEKHHGKKKAIERAFQDVLNGKEKEKTLKLAISNWFNALRDGWQEAVNNYRKTVKND